MTAKAEDDELRYRVLVDNRLLADLNAWWRGRLLGSAVRRAVDHQGPRIEVVQQYHFASDRVLIKTDDPEIAAVLVALQEHGHEGMAKAIRLLEAR